MVKNFKHSSKLLNVFESFDRLGIPYKATVLENSVLTEIEEGDKILKVACLIDNLETLDD